MYEMCFCRVGIDSSRYLAEPQFLQYRDKELLQVAIAYDQYTKVGKIRFVVSWRQTNLSG